MEESVKLALAHLRDKPVFRKLLKAGRPYIINMGNVTRLKSITLLSAV
ncbi:MAG: hypothetical protein ACE5KK_04985 [Candidatus Brocadiales bacterium]